MANKITCTCGHSWNKSDSSKKDVTVCHICGKNNMKNGGWLDAYDDVPQAQVGTMLAPITGDDVAKFFDMFSVPQKAVTKMVTGKYQTPSEAMNIKNPVGAFAIDMILDPVNLLGIGAATKAPKATKAAVKAVGPELSDLRYVTKRKPYQFDASKIENLSAKQQKQISESVGKSMDAIRDNAEKEAYKRHGSYRKDRSTGNLNPVLRDNMYMDMMMNLPDVNLVRRNENGGQIPQAENGIEGTMGGLTDKGFNYSPAWGGQFQMGGSLPGAVGFTYARTKGIPSEGPYAKKTMPSAQDGEEVEYKELPEITIVGSKDKSTRDFYNNLINKFSEDSNSNNPYVDQEIMGNYLGTMNLGKVYGFPKVKTETKEGIFKNAKGHYNPLTKTIYGNDLDTWVSEMAHHVQMKDNIVGKGLQWLGNDLVQYLKRPALELMNTFKYGTETSPWDYSDEDFAKWVNTNPYEKEGTVEHEAHSEIEPMLKEKIKRSREEYEESPAAKARRERFFAERKMQNGKEMKFYQAGLDFKPKTISQDGSEIPVDPMGYWNPENVGNPVIIPSNDITMDGVNQPLIGISDTGDVQYMYPGEDYEFDGESVTEYPVAQKGISVNKADEYPIEKLDQSLNFTNYNKPTKGGWLDRYEN